VSKFPDDALAIVSTGKFLTVGNAAQSTATLPLDSAGNTATVVQCVATTAMQINFGPTSAVAASTSTGIALCSNYPHRFKVKGNQFIAALTDTTGSLRVNAVEIG
jgi:hypothetical protein